MEGSNSRRIESARAVYLQLQIESIVIRVALFHREETPDGKRGSREAGASVREASPDSNGSRAVTIRVAQTVGIRRGDGLPADLGVRARNNRTSSVGPFGICARGGRSHGGYCR